MTLSIVIPVHNRVGLLREALASIARHHLHSSEVIVCDDGSSEDLPHLLEEYRDLLDGLVISRTEKSFGAQVARNRGLSLAQGKFVMFMDSDDALADGGIARFVEALQGDCDLDYVYGRVSRVDHTLAPFAGDTPVGSVFSDDPVDVAGYHWHTMGAVYRRSYLESVGPWNVELTGSQDWEYQARVKLGGGKRMFIDEVVGLWRQHDGVRVGTSSFRVDYVRSVMKACHSILSVARKRSKCDQHLEARIAKRLIVHALEWGANGYALDRRECLEQAIQSLSISGGGLRFGIIISKRVPRCFDRFLLNRLVGRN